LLSVLISKESATEQDNQPPKISKRPGQKNHQMPVNGDTSISALTFGTLLSSQESDAHRASDFRLKLRGNSPNFTVSLPAGQIGLFDPVSLRDSVSETRRGVFRLPRPSGSLLKGRPLSRPALAPTRRTLLTFTVKMQIEDRAYVLTCAEHTSTTPT
jgi:hypothetical protein